MKVYIAGPMFIESEIDYNLMLARCIRELKCTVRMRMPR